MVGKAIPNDRFRSTREVKIIFGTIFSRKRPGSTWYRMHLGLGLQKLGHEVYFVEEFEPEWSKDAAGQKCDYEHSVQRDLFLQTMKNFGVIDQACQICIGTNTTSGLSLDSLIALAKESDLLINLSGHLKDERILNSVKRRAYIDEDPVYTQLWCVDHREKLNLDAHDVFFSKGLNIGTSYTSIPDWGIRWHPLLPPLILDYWPFDTNHTGKRFTTIASWSRGSIVHWGGEKYSSKPKEFERFAELPKNVTQEFEIAFKKYREDDRTFRVLKENGWFLTEGSTLKNTSDYQSYIRQSRAEIGIAKNAYVKGKSGWFSERSSHYLASGKPVLLQSTGFERSLPTGEGLLTFSSMEDAVAGVERINSDYKKHCRRARELAAEVFDYTKILPKMLETCFA